MRYIRIAFLILLALALMTVALANRQLVVLHLLPQDMADFMGVKNQIGLPLFLVIFAGIVAGLLIGFIWEWLRAHRLRAQAAKAKRELHHLSREVSRLKGKAEKAGDDVLALIEGGGKAR